MAKALRAGFQRFIQRAAPLPVGSRLRIAVPPYGTDPADPRAAIGPHVAGTSYEVGPKEVAEVEAALVDRPGLAGEVLFPTEAGTAAPPAA